MFPAMPSWIGRPRLVALGVVLALLVGLAGPLAPVTQAVTIGSRTPMDADQQGEPRRRGERWQVRLFGGVERR